MNRPIIGLLFILCGIVYGCFAIDRFYSLTLGWLVANDWISQETLKKAGKNQLGRKTTILIYSLILIIIGIYILWNRNI